MDLLDFQRKLGSALLSTEKCGKHSSEFCTIILICKMRKVRCEDIICLSGDHSKYTMIMDPGVSGPKMQTYKLCKI